MIAIYAVYLDMYFIENLLLNASVLVLTALLWDKRLQWKRISIASFLGAVLSCGGLLVRIQGYSMSAICNLLQGLLVMKAAFWKTDIRGLLRGAVYFYTLSFVFTQVYEWLRGKLGELHGLVISVGVLLILSMAIAYLRYCKRKEKEDVYYDVEILGKGKKIQVRALHDTGNVLRDPISQKPVSIIEKSLLEEIWKLEEPQNFKCIPFRSIGKEQGVIMGMEVDALFIRKNDECIERYGEIVALYDGQLSSDGRFRMILHQGII